MLDYLSESALQEDVDYDLRDATQAGFRKELLERGKKKQVPFLYRESGDGSVISMYESLDIIDALKSR